MSDVLIAKLKNIEIAVKRIIERYGRDSGIPFAADLDKQDTVILNIQRIAGDLIDCCAHLISSHALGWPKDNREVVDLVQQAGLIDQRSGDLLRGLNGMRNILVHQYLKTDLNKVQQFVENDLRDTIVIAKGLLHHNAATPADRKGTIDPRGHQEG